MKAGLVGAWAVALGLVTWRELRGGAHLPVPGTWLAVTGLFGALAVVSDVFPPAAGVVTLGAWGLDVAGFLQAWRAGLGSQAAQATGQPSASPARTGPPPAPGTLA